MYERELLALADSGARYLVIGAVAMGLNKYPRATFDLDIFPDLERNNLEKIIITLKQLGYKPKIPVNLNELLDAEKRKEWNEKRNMKVFSFFNAKRPSDIVDLMIYEPINFNECFNRKKIVKLKGKPVYVASIGDLLKMKEKAGRKRDLMDIKILKRIKEIENER